jgi:glycosyltransferase involved in cell wall biosynthesis
MNIVEEIPGRVTIGIPTRNRCDLVIRAVQSALAQTYADVEVVISDNASTDDTARAIEEISDPRIVLLKQTENIGMAQNFNVCLNRASGEFFLMLSDDDMLEPGAIEELTRPFFDPPGGIPAKSIGVVWCPCMVLNAKGELLYTTAGGPPREIVAELLAGLFNGDRGTRFCGVLIRTTDARMVGGYRGDLYGALCDMANWGQAALRHDYAICVNRTLAKYTIHNSSESSKSACRDWQNWGHVMHTDLMTIIRDTGDPYAEKLMLAAHRNMIANLTLTILMQVIGQPGWIPYFCREVIHARKYLLTISTSRRLIREGWKIAFLQRK